MYDLDISGLENLLFQSAYFDKDDISTTFVHLKQETYSIEVEFYLYKGAFAKEPKTRCNAYLYARIFSHTIIIDDIVSTTEHHNYGMTLLLNLARLIIIFNQLYEIFQVYGYLELHDKSSWAYLAKRFYGQWSEQISKANIAMKLDFKLSYVGKDVSIEYLVLHEEEFDKRLKMKWLISYQ